jgi:Rieske Fe-S protein
MLKKAPSLPTGEGSVNPLPQGADTPNPLPQGEGRVRGSEVSATMFPIPAADERRLDRRRFLGAAGCAALLVAGGEWLARRGAAEATAPLEVAALDDASLAVGEARTVAALGGEVLAVKLVSGEVVAFDRRCPHLGCPVIWAAERQRFECPCHHAAFEARSGRVLFGPPRRGLTPAIVRSA